MNIEGFKKRDRISVFDKKGNDKTMHARYNSYIEVVRQFGVESIAGVTPAR